ncbi:MAG: serine protease [Candidatus Acidiferrales bacterium]|jgi:S1-C subfamily serine protease
MHSFEFMPVRARTIAAAILLVALFPALPAQAQENGAPTPQSAGGVPAAPSKFRVVRSISGTKGSVKSGEFVIEDPRTVFYLPADRQVIIYFEWEGPVGKHHFEALWKDPAGKVSAISDFDYDAAANRFGGYWKLALADDSPTGMWSLEARVDGETTGTHAFEVVSAPRPENLPSVRAPATPAEIYAKASAASVFIQKLGVNGEQLSVGSGFLVSDGVVVTAFQVIDGASKLRVILGDGRHVVVDDVAAWNRRGDWVVLRVPADNLPVLLRAKVDSWNVGDRCFALDSPSEGSRSLAAGTVTGKGSVPGAGERINISMFLSDAGIGSPLVDEYGDVIGLIGGRLVPGVSALEAATAGYTELVGTATFSAGSLAVPITVIPTAADGKSASLAELARTGQFISQVNAKDAVIYGMFTSRVEWTNGFVRAPNGRTTFSRNDANLFVVISWQIAATTQSKKKTLGMTALRVYDVDNQLRAAGDPQKVQRSPNSATQTVAKLSLANLPPGIYRADVLFNDDIAWRGFFRVTP